ncbi:flavin reductase [Novosphingobium sp. YJ-S2-02]|uniref:Flavin reductase n=1 Tax=Novosphingobium aureum TaxID=2792964 RepID=A0A931H9X9_9SPHN|nr:flavin reductase [Novosphingobium aureum]MBH0111889.1 flavin reductase [Novosphingobium aureum]
MSKPGASVDAGGFRAAMAQLGAAVNIVTTDGVAGRYGITASAVCSVTDSPASLLVCVNRASRMHAALRANGVLAVNVLTPDHEALCAAFATGGLSIEERFAGGSWQAMNNGVPGLEGALVRLACRIETVTEVGTHAVIIARVEQVVLRGEGEGLVYFDRTFHRLPLTPALSEG